MAIWIIFGILAFAAAIGYAIHRDRKFQTHRTEMQRLEKKERNRNAYRFPLE